MLKSAYTNHEKGRFCVSSESWYSAGRIESDFEYNGYRCLVRATEMGHRCGYVVLPQGHALESDSQTVDKLSVHGGVTFFKEVDGNWVVGFDCAHIGDAKDSDLVPEPIRAVLEGANLDSRSDEDVADKFFRSLFDGHVWTCREVQDECVNLVNEIISVSE